MAKIEFVGCAPWDRLCRLMSMPVTRFHAVTLWPDHAERCHPGCAAEGASGDVRAIHASTTTGDWALNLVIIATKRSTWKRQRNPAAVARSGDYLQSIQNGVGSPEIAAPILGADRLASAWRWFGASIRAPGHAHHNGMEMIRFAPLPDCQSSCCRRRQKSGSRPGQVALFDDIKQMSGKS